MAITTYSELQTAVANWLNRSDLTTYIPDFITLCEKKLNRDLLGGGMFVRGMEKRSDTTTVGGQNNYGLPSDFLQMRSVMVDAATNSIVEYMTPDKMRQYEAGTSQDRPRFYTIIGDEMLFAPVPSGSYTIEIDYLGSITALSSSNTTNWFTTNCPDLLLYGSLIQAEPFIKNDARIQTWKAMYDMHLDALIEADQVSRYPATTMMPRVL
jgi:hypothetical protein